MSIVLAVLQIVAVERLAMVVEVVAVETEEGEVQLVGEVVEAGFLSDADPLTLKETGWHYGG